MEKAIVNYSTKMGMTARKSVKIERPNLDEVRDFAAALVNGDTYTYTIIFESGKLKGFLETHAYHCAGKNCNCVFKSENPERIRKQK
jgi:hypothetical protein